MQGVVFAKTNDDASEKPLALALAVAVPLAVVPHWPRRRALAVPKNLAKSNNMR